MDYVRDTMDWLMGKGRRKADKDAPSSDGTPGPPYLDPAGAKFPTQFLTPALLPAYVRLPLGLDQDEWLATHTISFFEHVNLLYGCLSEYCNIADCSSMNGPQQSQYYWVDEKGKKTKYPASGYIDFVMTFVHKLITDESVFPTKYGNTFPANFLSLVKRAWRYLFHVIAHMYAAHFAQLFSLQLHPHLHTLFVHFSVFNKEFGLVEEDETRVLDDLLDLLLAEGMAGAAGPLPPLTTSQSDGALHSRTRVDPSLLGGGSGDARSLPRGGVTTTTTTAAFLGSSAPSDSVALAGVGAAEPSGDDDDDESESPSNPDDDDDIDGVGPHIIVDSSPCAAGPGEDDDDDDDDGFSPCGGGGGCGATRPRESPLLNGDEIRTRLSPSPLSASCSTDQCRDEEVRGEEEEEAAAAAARLTVDLPSSISDVRVPTRSSLESLRPTETHGNVGGICRDTSQPMSSALTHGDDDDDDVGLESPAADLVDDSMKTMPSQPAFDSVSSFSTHRGGGGGGGGGGGTTTTTTHFPSDAVAAPAVTTTFSSAAANSVIEIKEEDKENLSPMSDDLNTSVDGATETILMAVESMEVVMDGRGPDDDDDDDDDNCQR